MPPCQLVSRLTHLLGASLRVSLDQVSPSLSNMASVTDGIQVLSPGFGYGLVIGIGVFFALLMYV
jgi:hypothetical protein